MLFVSEIKTSAPAQFLTPLQEKVYRTLEELHISFERVETGEAITMEDCIRIEARLQMKMVKTLFLCNRQQTAYCLFITVGNKPFSFRRSQSRPAPPLLRTNPPLPRHRESIRQSPMGNSRRDCIALQGEKAQGLC